MCGIAGIYSLSGEPVLNGKARVDAMINTLRHRGPDQAGSVVSSDGMLALGVTRLAIVDPNCNHPLPFTDDIAGTMFGYNGELYDHHEKREWLISRGEKFKTSTDTETFFKLLNTSGIKCLEEADGMWALAFYEEKARRLTLSRDLLGERHIFYASIGSEVIFASEVAAILAVSPTHFDMDFQSVAAAILFQSASPGSTLVSGIKRLLPGHNLIAELGQPIVEKCFRKLDLDPWLEFHRSGPSNARVHEVFQELFSQCVDRRIPSDVMFTSTLSGGIDSCLIASQASAHGSRNISTIFGQSGSETQQRHVNELDEYSASLVSASLFNTNHTRIDLHGSDSLPVLERISASAYDGCIDQGTASFELLGHHIRSMGQRVVLIADGPDEFVGGYEIDRKAYAMDQYRQQHPGRFLARRVMSAPNIGRRALQRFRFTDSIISLKHRYSPFSLVPIHQGTNADLLANMVEWKVIKAALKSYGGIPDRYADVAGRLEFSQCRALSYASQSLPDMFNLRTDKAFMRASVESRVPFQAPALAEFLISLPANYRFGCDGQSTKSFLRDIIRERVGPEIADRPKHGFAVPPTSNYNIYKSLKIDEVVLDSNLYLDLPVKKGAREFMATKANSKLKWMFYVISKTNESLKSFNGLRVDSGNFPRV